MDNLKSYNYCAIPDSDDAPVWLKIGRPAPNLMSFGTEQVVDVWELARYYADQRGDMEGIVRPATPDLFTLDTVPFGFDEEAECPRFLQYLSEVFPDEQVRKQVRMMAGYLLAGTAKHEVFFALLGAGANGKTVLLDVLTGMLGHHNVSYVALSNLCERFQTWPLVQSKVNICGDMPTDVGRASLHQIEGQFKHLVSGGEMEVERKGKDIYKARCRARFVMAGNTLPTFRDRSDGIWRRMRVIEFPVTISESDRDPDLADWIVKQELPGVLMWAVRGLSEVQHGGGIPDTARGEELKGQHRESCDHERVFLTDHYTEGLANDVMPSATVYEEYKRWMSDNGYRPMGASKFIQRLQAVMPRVHRDKVRRNGGNPRWYLVGLQRIDQDEGVPPVPRP